MPGISSTDLRPLVKAAADGLADVRAGVRLAERSTTGIGAAFENVGARRLGGAAERLASARSSLRHVTDFMQSLPGDAPALGTRLQQALKLQADELAATRVLTPEDRRSTLLALHRVRVDAERAYSGLRGLQLGGGLDALRGSGALGDEAARWESGVADGMRYKLAMRDAADAAELLSDAGRASAFRRPVLVDKGIARYDAAARASRDFIPLHGVQTTEEVATSADAAPAGRGGRQALDKTVGAARKLYDELRSAGTTGGGAERIAPEARAREWELRLQQGDLLVRELDQLRTASSGYAHVERVAVGRRLIALATEVTEAAPAHPKLDKALKDWMAENLKPERAGVPVDTINMARRLADELHSARPAGMVKLSTEQVLAIQHQARVDGIGRALETIRDGAVAVGRRVSVMLAKARVRSIVEPISGKLPPRAGEAWAEWQVVAKHVPDDAGAGLVRELENSTAYLRQRLAAVGPRFGGDRSTAAQEFARREALGRASGMLDRASAAKSYTVGAAATDHFSTLTENLDVANTSNSMRQLLEDWRVLRESSLQPTGVASIAESAARARRLLTEMAEAQASPPAKIAPAVVAVERVESGSRLLHSALSSWEKGSQFAEKSGDSSYATKFGMAIEHLTLAAHDLRRANARFEGNLPSELLDGFPASIDLLEQQVLRMYSVLESYGELKFPFLGELGKARAEVTAVTDMVDGYLPVLRAEADKITGAPAQI